MANRRTAASNTVRVLVNPTAGAGKGAAAIGPIAAAVRSAQDCEVIRTQSAAHAQEAAAEAVAAGAPRVIVAGGDGMVHAVVQALAGTTTELGIVPVGSANDAAASLGLTRGDLAEWVQVAAHSPALSLDVGRCEHGWFLSVLTFGVSGAIVERSNQFRLPLGQMRYTAATLLTLPHWKPIPLRMTVDGVAQDTAVMLMALGNTPQFGGGMRICPAADPTDGELDLVLVKDVSIPTVLSVFPRVFTGGHLRHRAVSQQRGRTFEFATRDGFSGPVAVYGDGEKMGLLPIAVTVVPHALRVAGAAPGRP